MYNSDPGFYVENNWNKDPKFIVENNWNKDPGFFIPEKQGKDFLREYLSGREDYSQSGTDIPNFSTGSGGAFAAGSDFPGQGFGYQYQSPTTIAGSPSFDMNKPYIPGQQDYTGIPNATPEMLRRLQQRKTRNPGGQEDLPGFLKPV